jgi:rod shape-determining protein MreD
MRRTILAAAAVVVALVLQLTTINGLRLPGGAVPDLVLLVVVAFGLASGPATGAVTGFTAGLCLDLAPPGTGLVGEYALAFCLIGWACGRFRGTLARSALLPIMIAATGAVAGELMVAALGLALQPEQVTWTAVRQVLPVTLLYDVLASPFVLYLILLAGAWLTDGAADPAVGAGRARALAGATAAAPGSLPGRTGLGGTAGLGGPAAGAVLLGLGGWLAGPPQTRRARRAAARQAHRLRPGGRPGDGWVGGSARSRGGLGGLDSPSFRIRAAGGRAMRGQAFSGRTVSSITRGGAGNGTLSGGGPGGSALGRAAHRGGLHGGAVARLRSGVAGSAASGQLPRTLPSSTVRLRLGGSRKMGGRGAVVVGRAMSRASLSRLGRRRTRGGGFRPAIMPGGSAGARRPARVHLASAAPVRFGTRSRGGLVGGGVLSQAGRARTRAASPRLHLQAGRSAAGRTSAGRPATPRFRSRPLTVRRPQSGRRPRFRNRPWSVVALLTRRHGGLLTPRRVRGLGGGRGGAPGFRRTGAGRAGRGRTGGPR